MSGKQNRSTFISEQPWKDLLSTAKRGTQYCRTPPQRTSRGTVRTHGGLEGVFPHHNEASNLHVYLIDRMNTPNSLNPILVTFSHTFANMYTNEYLKCIILVKIDTEGGLRQYVW